MDFAVLPPETNSGLMYAGAGAGPMLAAATAWSELAADLYLHAASYRSVVTGLTTGSWQGPASAAMAVAAAPYLTWMTATAAQCEQVAGQAAAAVSAYETAFAMTVPPPVIAANRAQLAALVATNVLGQNTPAIMAAEAHYGEMWAQDAAAMYGYAGSSAAAAALTPFSAPQPNSNPAGTSAVAGLTRASSTGTHSTAASTLGGLSGLLGAATGSSSGAADLGADAAGLGADGAGLATDVGGLGTDFAGVGLDFLGADELTQTGGLGALGNFGFGSFGPDGLAPVGGADGAGAAAGLGQAGSIGALSVPQGWADVTTAGGWTGVQGAGPVSAAGAVPLPSSTFQAAPAVSTVGSATPRVSMPGLAGRVADTAVQKFGFRSTVIPQSPLAG